MLSINTKLKKNMTMLRLINIFMEKKNKKTINENATIEWKKNNKHKL